MNAAEQLAPIATEPLSWAEICAQYPDQFFALTVFPLGHKDIDGLVGMNFLRHFNFEVRPADHLCAAACSPSSRAAARLGDTP